MATAIAPRNSGGPQAAARLTQHSRDFFGISLDERAGGTSVV
jgi:hypothetical protein